MSNESNLYYFYTVGCGFCKKADPIVDELNKEGHNILKLDLAEKENKEIVEDLKKKYNIQCGTPLFVNAETGIKVCGYREKDTILKWIAGEEIPEPPRPTGPMPRPPFHGAKKSEVDKWKKDYKIWKEENSHMPNLREAKEILDTPRPKSMPPQPPPPTSTKEEQGIWKEKYEKWSKENDHLPNIFPADKILERINSQKTVTNSSSQVVDGSIDQRLKNIEDNVNKLMNHLGVK